MEPQKILIDNRQEAKVPTPPLSKKTEQILNALGCEGCEISLVIMDDQEISELNRTFRNISKPTNVLSFPMQEGEFSGLNPELLGDVIISVEKAREQAKELNHSLEEELTLLTVHGVLHLLGYSDETEEEKQVMADREKDILKRISHG